MFIASLVLGALCFTIVLSFIPKRRWGENRRKLWK